MYPEKTCSTHPDAEAGDMFLIYGKTGVAGGQVKKGTRVSVIGMITEDQVSQSLVGQWKGLDCVGQWKDWKEERWEGATGSSEQKHNMGH